MPKAITIRSTSRTSAVGPLIILRETNSTRLVFCPEIVVNPKDPRACVKGTFVFQRKKLSGNWEEYKTLDLSKLKDQEWVKLEVKSEELLTLLQKLNEHYEIYEKYGIQSGKINYLATRSDAKEYLLQLITDPRYASVIQDLEPDDFKRFNLVANLNGLKRAVNDWSENCNNDDEEYWQRYFTMNPWILAQVFTYPVLLIKDQAYVGGKELDNTGGKIIDYLFKNDLSNNCLLVEIKTPTEKLVGPLYRKPDVYAMSTALVGSMDQVLNYKDSIQRHASDLEKDSVKIFDPKCLLIIGSEKSESFTPNTRKAFELYRSDSKNVEIITFDELFRKVQLLIDLIEV